MRQSETIWMKSRTVPCDNLKLSERSKLREAPEEMAAVAGGGGGGGAAGGAGELGKEVGHSMIETYNVFLWCCKCILFLALVNTH